MYDRTASDIRYRDANREKIASAREAKREELRKKARDYYSANKAARLAYKARNYREKRDSILQSAREYCKRPEVLERERERSRLRRATRMGKLNRHMSLMIRRSLQGSKGGRSWSDIAGYTLGELCIHLERQFVKGMGWHNRNKWHIDHIIPLSSFVFDGPDDPEFKAAWAITNLRPLWSGMNLAKAAKRELLL